MTSRPRDGFLLFIYDHFMTAHDPRRDGGHQAIFCNSSRRIFTFYAERIGASTQNNTKAST